MFYMEQKNMRQILSLEELSLWMSIPKNESKDSIALRFKKIAEFLINKCSIEYRGMHYRFIDLEFYYFSDNHRDISTHPRQSKALTWYINDFGGIDLNFESKIERVRIETKNKVSYKYRLTHDALFGGILIRQIKELASGDILDGPWKVADLFRETDALSRYQDNPILIMENHKEETIIESTRLNLLGSCKTAEKKTSNNLCSCFCESHFDKSTLTSELKTFNDQKYRFTINK